MNLVYVLILTTYIAGDHQSRPVAVAQTSISGFTTEQACKSAGKAAAQGAPTSIGHPRFGSQVTVTYQCSPLSL